MTSPRTVLDAVPPDRAALWLDFDGTLLDIAETPDAIAIPHDLGPLLRDLAQATNGATAVITGRSIADLRRHLRPAPAWIVGCHGGEWHGPDCNWIHPLNGSETVRAVQRQMAALTSLGDGVITEFKTLGAVVHYRQAPYLRDALARAAQAIAAGHPGFTCHRAKMAFELRPHDVGKDHVLHQWMQAAPFRGRVPIYMGDDLTDEPAMEYAKRMGGLAVKVGPGASVAGLRLGDPAGLRDTLRHWISGPTGRGG